MAFSSSFVATGWHLDSQAGPRGRGLLLGIPGRRWRKPQGTRIINAAVEARGTDERKPPGDWMKGPQGTATCSPLAGNCRDS